MIISDCRKGFVTNELLALVRKAARFLSVDPKPNGLLNYSTDLLYPQPARSFWSLRVCLGK